jgi:hypothetical protein
LALRGAPTLWWADGHRVVPRGTGSRWWATPPVNRTVHRGPGHSPKAEPGASSSQENPGYHWCFGPQRGDRWFEHRVARGPKALVSYKGSIRQ